jgi:hypothetical protein
MNEVECPECGGETRLGQRHEVVCRGDREITVEVVYAECVNCSSPEPLRFQTQALMAANDERAELVWRGKYGDPLPDEWASPAERRACAAAASLRSEKPTSRS